MTCIQVSYLQGLDGSLSGGVLDNDAKGSGSTLNTSEQTNNFTLSLGNWCLEKACHLFKVELQPIRFDQMKKICEMAAPIIEKS